MIRFFTFSPCYDYCQRIDSDIYYALRRRQALPDDTADAVTLMPICQRAIHAVMPPFAALIALI